MPDAMRPGLRLRRGDAPRGGAPPLAPPPLFAGTAGGDAPSLLGPAAAEGDAATDLRLPSPFPLSATAQAAGGGREAPAPTRMATAPATVRGAASETGALEPCDGECRCPLRGDSRSKRPWVSMELPPRSALGGGCRDVAGAGANAAAPRGVHSPSASIAACMGGSRGRSSWRGRSRAGRLRAPPRTCACPSSAAIESRCAARAPAPPRWRRSWGGHGEISARLTGDRGEISGGPTRARARRERVVLARRARRVGRGRRPRSSMRRYC